MREDFGKVVIERPRRGSREPNKATRGRLSADQILAAVEDDFEDDLGNRRPMSMGGHMVYWKKMWGKEFSDLLGPLNNFLHCNIGRSVNALRSELAKVLGGRSEPQRHVLTVHFENYFDRIPSPYQSEGFYEDSQGRLQYWRRPRYRVSLKIKAETQATRDEWEAKRHKPATCPDCALALVEHNRKKSLDNAD